MSSIAIVHNTPSSAIVAGVHTVSATAIPLVATSTPCRGVLIQRIGANSVSWGDATAQPAILSSLGFQVYVPIADANDLYIKGTASDSLGYIIFK